MSEAIAFLNIDNTDQCLLICGLHTKLTQTLGFIVRRLLPLFPINYHLLRHEALNSTSLGDNASNLSHNKV